MKACKEAEVLRKRRKTDIQKVDKTGQVAFNLEKYLTAKALKEMSGVATASLLTDLKN